MPEPITISASVFSQMFLYLTSLRVDIDGFLRSLGVDPADVRTPDARIPVDTYLADTRVCDFGESQCYCINFRRKYFLTDLLQFC